MKNKKSVLIAYPAMMLGGSTTSLLSILYNLDYSKYEVDLALAFYSGDWMSDIPRQIKLLEPVYQYQEKKERYIHRLFSPKYMVVKGISKIMEILDGYPVRGQQFLGMMDVDFYRDLEKEYDVAIAFLEGQTCKYVANHVKAKEKITWVHVDYKEARMCVKYDVPSLEKYKHIIHVSEKCLNSFTEMYPNLADRCSVIENILSQTRLRHLAEELTEDLMIDNKKINIVTTCRITYYQKGLDRTLNIISKMVEEDKKLHNKIHWYIIGNGPDYEDFKQRIKEKNLEAIITVLGAQKNPYKFYTKMDCFFLPSRYEGKPMAVTEALMLGLPAIVTEYSSANEQIQDGIEGKVFDNSEKGTEQALYYMMNHRDEMNTMKQFILQKDYSNVEEMKKIEALLDEGE